MRNTNRLFAFAISLALSCSLCFSQKSSTQIGDTIKLSITNSKIYPGTERNVWVWVPKQYDGTKPACLLVCMDGIMYDAPRVMTQLISSGEMPVTIGVFVNPGVIKQDGKVVRYNRSNEFDKMADEFADFLETEVLPLAQTVTTADGRKVRISTDANDRAITGASSGGICAFNVAWQRPDLYSRVYSAVGTYVAMRGGNDFPALVRKTEPKPLRIFMQDGEKDAWNELFGHWFEYNKLMLSALQFAGYEVKHMWDDGGHSIKYGTIDFPDAMRYLWAGYPNKINAGTSKNNMLSEIIKAGCDWEAIKCNEFPQARIIPTIIEGNRVDSYASISGKGSYFTSGESLFYYNGKITKQEAVATGNQLAIYPDGTMMVQSENNSNWLCTYIIQPDGTLAYGERFYWLHNTANHCIDNTRKLIFDENGNLWVATSMGIQVCDQNGRVRAILQLPGKTAIDDMEFIGDTIYVKSGDKLYKRVLNVKAFNPENGTINPKSQGQG